MRVRVPRTGGDGFELSDAAFAAAAICASLVSTAALAFALLS